MTRSLATPKWVISGSTCVSTNDTDLYKVEEIEPSAGVMSNKLRTEMDSTFGHSGAPWFYCPAGDDDECLSGQLGFVYGVESGFRSTINRVVGAKSSYFRYDALDR